MEKLQGVQILIADDSEIATEMLSYFLTEEGSQVEVANNGKEAVQSTLGQSFDVILMDIQMPICDGIEATKQIRQHDTQVPIIAVTGASKAEATAFPAYGFTDYIAKPIDFSELRQTILDCINTQKLQRMQG